MFLPVLTLSKMQGRVGQTIKIVGRSLDHIQEVSFNGIAANFIHSGNYLKVTIPDLASSGPVLISHSMSNLPLDLGYFSITASSPAINNQAAAALSNTPLVAYSHSNPVAKVATNTPRPIINSILPSSGKVLTTITLKGSNLDTVQGITFKGCSSITNFRLISAGEIAVEVPQHARSGEIQLLLKSGASLTSPKFTVRRPLTLAEAISSAFGFGLIFVTLAPILGVLAGFTGARSHLFESFLSPSSYISFPSAWIFFGWLGFLFGWEAGIISLIGLNIVAFLIACSRDFLSANYHVPLWIADAYGTAIVFGVVGVLIGLFQRKTVD
jgi:hypothetical protein